MTIFPKWLLNTDKIPNPKGSCPKMLKKFPGNGCMDDLLFYVFFNSISVTDYVRVIMMELFLRLERSPPRSWGGIKPGMDNLPLHVLSNSISIISHPPAPGGIKPEKDNPRPPLQGESNQEWIICHFTFFQTVYRSYQDDEGMMMKGCVKWNTVYDKEDFSHGSPRPAGQRLTH